MNFRLLRNTVFFSLNLILVAAPLRAVSWFPLGPYGGDARSFAADPSDPRHLYLGTATGWIYDSHDGGASWNRIAQIDERNDLVIDHILVDPLHPKHILVGAYFVDRPDGGLYLSDDAGRTWYAQAEMHGQSVRSLARSASNPNELVAGTLTGVFRSLDDGIHWKPISPANSAEIHEIESIAIDPTDPNVIYAGTWHLPWKTTDGGETWKSIKDGIIEDSDVFSIIIDPAQPNIVYASACSGIYKSVNGGELFKGGVTINRTQGLGSTAYRTRKLEQDPKHPETIYAGTTQGLYRSISGGERWSLLTDADVIVNDIWVDPSNPDHVLIATDRGGVYASDNAAVSFHASNAGFSTRQVSAYAADPDRPATLYVGVVNDKETGGVFQSTDGGLRWEQESEGLDGSDVFSLMPMPGGGLLAGTTHGIYRLQSGVWTQAGAPAASAVAHAVAEKRPPQPVRSHTVRPHTVAESPQEPVAAAVRLDGQVFAFASASGSMYAATSRGLLRGNLSGNAWTPVPSLSLAQPRFLAAHDSVLLAADFKHLATSQDNGRSWQVLRLPPELTQIGAIAVDNLNNLWAGGAEGIFLSSDYGAKWLPVPDLAVTQVDSIFFDAPSERLLITTASSTFVFAVHLPDYKVNYWAAGWKLRFARPVGDHLIGATLYDGMVVQPLMVDSKFIPASSAINNIQQASAERRSMQPSSVK
jgi:photosystem II stability/assembly factor-like uncharacterized protein